MLLAIPERVSTSAASDTAFGRFCEVSIEVEGQISEPWYYGINIGLCRRQFVTSTAVCLNKIYFFLKFAWIVGGFRVGPLQILVLFSTQDSSEFSEK